MKLGITGLSQTGKTTVFEALTGNISETGNKTEDRIGTIRVPDNRVDILSRMYQPKKTIYAQVEYLLPGMGSGAGKDGKGDQQAKNTLRDCDALIHVIRNFGGYGFEKPAPARDFMALDQELVLSDLMVVEKRLERLELDKKRGKPPEAEELNLLKACKDSLDNEIPLRKNPDLAGARILKGYAFLSAKPMLALFNNEDDDENLPGNLSGAGNLCSKEDCMIIRAKLEQELGQMTPEEAADFLSEFNISSPATDRVIARSYTLMGLMSFFTVGEDEVRAWTIKNGTEAVDAAEVIHSDIKKGFIRAEVLSYDDLMEAGSYAEARKKGTVRLEGKTYVMQDGDIVNFRFNV